MQTTKMLSTKAYEQWLKEQEQLIVRYRQVEKSDILAEYMQLKAIVESAKFQAKKQELITTRYADTKEGQTMAEYKKLRKTSSVFFYRLIKKAAWKEKFEVAQYLVLAEQIKVAEFQQANTFWKNPKRWFTTPEFQQEKRYNTLAKHADIKFYEQHSDQEIAELESYKMVWADEFETGRLSETWKKGFLYPSKELKANHSHVSEQQAYTQGKNTQVGNRVFSILTKKQKTTAPAWHPNKGMIMQAFTYTSDIWHTEEAVAPQAGLLQTKVRYMGKAKHMLCLTTPKAQKAISILGDKVAKKHIICTVVWNDKEVINYVNNIEVSRSKNPLKGEDLHLLVRSYLPENQKAGKGQIDIDWIRIYTNSK